MLHHRLEVKQAFFFLLSRLSKGIEHDREGLVKLLEALTQMVVVGKGGGKIRIPDAIQEAGQLLIGFVHKPKELNQLPNKHHQHQGGGHVLFVALLYEHHQQSGGKSNEDNSGDDPYSEMLKDHIFLVADRVMSG